MYEMLLASKMSGGYVPPNLMIVQITKSSSARTMGMTLTNVTVTVTFDVPGSSTHTGGGTSGTTVLVPIPANASFINVNIVAGTGLGIPTSHFTTNASIVEGIVGWGTMDSRLNIRMQGCNNLLFVPENGPTWTNWSSLFLNCTRFNGDISMWDTSHVTTMNQMFNGASAFNGWLNYWDIGNVTDLSSMFQGNRIYNQPLSNWNTSKVTSLRSFMSNISAPSAFNQSIANWDVSKVTDMRTMFFNCSNYDRDLSGMVFPLVTAAMRLNYDAGTTAWPANRKPTFAL